MQRVAGQFLWRDGKARKMRLLLAIRLFMTIYPFRSRPTGYLHIGARTALFSGHTRASTAAPLSRIEDTDVERSTPKRCRRSGRNEMAEP